MSPSIDYFVKSSQTIVATTTTAANDMDSDSDISFSPSPSSELELSRMDGVYSNPRLDPSNFLDGPLSLNPATRLRQMLARPGIVVGCSKDPRERALIVRQVAPGICDGISARCALEAGFSCLYQRYSMILQYFKAQAEDLFFLVGLRRLHLV